MFLSLKKQFKSFLTFFLTIILFLNSTNAYAIYDNARNNVRWDTDDRICRVGSIDFDMVFRSNDDATWEMTNPVCLGFIAAIGIAFKLSGMFVNRQCIATNNVGMMRTADEKARNPVPDSPYLNPNVGYKVAYYASLCSARQGEALTTAGTLQQCATVPACLFSPAGIYASAQATAASSDSSRCCQAYAMYMTILTSAIAYLGGVYGFAKDAFDNNTVCGNGWNGWQKFDTNGDRINIDSDADAGRTIAQKRGIWRQSYYPGSYQYCLNQMFIYGVNSCNFENVDGIAALDTTLKNRYYREYLYGGIEYEDNNSGSCDNPWKDDAKARLTRLGYDSDKQRFYMRGPGVASNYACHRFVLTAKTNPKTEEMQAYQCCKKRSQNTICIDHDSSGVASNFGHSFCEFGKRCPVASSAGAPVVYDIFWSKVNNNFLCAKTYTVCPYNHNLGGGTEVTKYVGSSDGMPTSEIENYCQVMKHCAKLPVAPYVRISSLTNEYISSACKDMKGDSQNVYDFNSELLPFGRQTGFSAPIAQCLKETLENMLLNKAGDSKCLNPDEAPDFKGECDSGYFYKKGSYLNKRSPFIRLQDGLQMVIKIVLSISISLFGAMVLLGMQPISKKQLLGYIIKIALLMYFALGDGWQSGFIEGVLSASSALGDIVMKIDREEFDNNGNAITDRLDGCQFPRYNYASDKTDPNRFDNAKYPPGLEYLKIWDTLDCKLMRSLGYGPNVSVPNLVIMLVAGIFTGGLGVLFLMASFVFAFFFLALILRALHIFLMSTISLVILIYVSPITITCSLFQKTKSIFDNWLKQMLGLSLQPVILFAYLGIFISIFEYAIVGKDIRFSGNGKEVPKTIICNDASDDNSLYCIFRISQTTTYTGLDAIGIGIPVLLSMNKDKFQAIIKAAILMFVFSNFMDKVSSLAKELVGGVGMTSKTPSALGVARGVQGTTRAIQKRGSRFLKNKAIPVVASLAVKGVKAVGNLKGNRGRAAKIGGGPKKGEAIAHGQANNNAGANNNVQVGNDPHNNAAGPQAGGNNQGNNNNESES